MICITITIITILFSAHTLANSLAIFCPRFKKRSIFYLTPFFLLSLQKNIHATHVKVFSAGKLPSWIALVICHICALFLRFLCFSFFSNCSNAFHSQKAAYLFSSNLFPMKIYNVLFALYSSSSLLQLHHERDFGMAANFFILA